MGLGFGGLGGFGAPGGAEKGAAGPEGRKLSIYGKANNRRN